MSKLLSVKEFAKKHKRTAPAIRQRIALGQFDGKMETIDGRYFFPEDTEFPGKRKTGPKKKETSSVPSFSSRK